MYHKPSNKCLRRLLEHWPQALAFLQLYHRVYDFMLIFLTLRLNSLRCTTLARETRDYLRI